MVVVVVVVVMPAFWVNCPEQLVASSAAPPFSKTFSYASSKGGD